MKSIRSLAILALCAPAPAQQPPTLAELYQAKLDKQFVENTSWHRELPAARRAARKDDKVIFAYFTRSDRPCPAADALEDTVFASEWWKEFAEGSVNYLNIETGLADTPEQGMLRKKAGSDHPHCVFLDRRGDVVWMGTPTDPTQMETARANAALLAELRAGRRQLTKAKMPIDEPLQFAIEVMTGINGLQDVALKRLVKLADTEGIDPRVSAAAEPARFRQRLRDASQKPGTALAFYRKHAADVTHDVSGLYLLLQATQGAIDAKQLDEANKIFAELRRRGENDSAAVRRIGHQVRRVMKKLEKLNQDR